MRSRRSLGFALVVTVAGFAASPAGAHLPQQDGAVGFDQANVRVAGLDTFVDTLAAAGDVNGDGLGDLLAGSIQAAPLGRTGAGQVRVIFGRRDGLIDASAPGAGITIMGSANLDLTGPAAAAGDVNGDGRGDIVVGASFANHPTDPARTNAGAAYVIFGQAAPADVDLASLGTHGFRINGAAQGDQAGFSVAGAGDVNADGLADLIVGARFAGPSAPSDLRGAAYVVFGRSSTATIELASLGTGGFRINGAQASDWLGYSVAPAGDLNADGKADVAVGAWSANPAVPLPRNDAGAVYVIYGRTAGPVNVAAMSPTDGYTIAGGAVGDHFGASLADAGDVNGDGRTDLVAGSVFADPNGRNQSGTATVLFGGAASGNLDTAILGAAGVRFDGAVAGAPQGIGESVAGVGDVNGDGFGDIVTASSGGQDRAFVGLGGTSTTPVDFATPVGRAILISGSLANTDVRAPAAGVGDINGDGRPDFAAVEQAGTALASGQIGVFYGTGTARFSYPAATGELALDKNQAMPPLDPTIAARTGSPTFTVAPALPAGLGIDPATGRIGGTPTAASAATDYTVTMTDLTDPVSQVVRLGVRDLSTPIQARDLTAPIVTVGGRLAQRILATGRVAATVSCNEACTGTVKATLVLPNGKLLALGVKKLTRAGAGVSAFRFTLTPTRRKRIRAALATRRTLKVRITARATDTSGNAATPKLRVITVRR